MHAILGKPRRALLVCCCALAMSPAAAFDEAQLYINNAPPYSYVDEGREAGLVYDLLDQMAARAGFRSHISSVPFKRIAVQLSMQPSSLAAIWRQPEVELSYIWIVKLLEEPAILVARSDTAGDISSIDAARKLRVGVVLGSPAELIARRLGFQHIEVSTSAVSNARKLDRGRIDAWLGAQCDRRRAAADPQQPWRAALRSAYRKDCHVLELRATLQRYRHRTLEKGRRSDEKRRQLRAYYRSIPARAALITSPAAWDG